MIKNGERKRPLLRWLALGFQWSKINAVTIYNSQDMETASMSINRWMEIEDVVHICSGKPLSHIKEWNNAICSNVIGPRDYRTKWSRSERETNIMWYHLYVKYEIWHKGTYLWNIQNQTHKHRKQICGC